MLDFSDEIVNVTTLKGRLGYYLALAKSGQEIIVTSHRIRVARISPVASPTVSVISALRPVKDLFKLKGVRTHGSNSAIDALINDRRHR